MQGVVTYIPVVLTPATGIKVRSLISGQAVKLEMIKRSRRPFALLKSRSRWVLSFDSTHTRLAIKGRWCDQAIKVQKWPQLNFGPGCGCQYSRYSSDHPLVCNMCGSKPYVIGFPTAVNLDDCMHPSHYRC